MGVYSTSQFAGAFIGGLFGGWAHQSLGIEAVFLLGAIITLIWLLIALKMSKPKRHESKLLQLEQMSQNRADKIATTLLEINGVVEAVVVGDEGLAYLKIDKDLFLAADLDAFIAGQA